MSPDFIPAAPPAALRGRCRKSVPHCCTKPPAGGEPRPADGPLPGPEEAHGCSSIQVDGLFRQTLGQGISSVPCAWRGASASCRSDPSFRPGPGNLFAKTYEPFWHFNSLSALPQPPGPCGRARRAGGRAERATLAPHCCVGRRGGWFCCQVFAPVTLASEGTP
jgi:hypothetical protein